MQLSFARSLVGGAICAASLFVGIAPVSEAQARPRMSSAKRVPQRAPKSKAKPKSASSGSSKGSRATHPAGLATLPPAELKRRRDAFARKSISRAKRPVDGLEIQPERPKPVGKYEPKVHYRGVEATRLDDADGADEPAVWIAFVHYVPGPGYVPTVNRILPSRQFVVGGRSRRSTYGSRELVANNAHALLVSAVVEDDDGSAEDDLAALDDLLAQAITAARLLEGDGDPFITLQAMLEIGQTGLGPKHVRPDLRIVEISERALDAMYDRPPQSTRGIRYKLATTHRVGKGAYRILFDVPHPKGHKPRRLVKVTVDELDYTRVNPLQNGVLSAQVCIGDRCEWAVPGPHKPAVVYRWMRQSPDVKLSVAGHLKNKTRDMFWWVNLHGNGSVKKTIDTRKSPVRLEFVHEGQYDPSKDKRRPAGSVRLRINH